MLLNCYLAMGTNYKSPQPQPKLMFNPLPQGQKSCADAWGSAEFMVTGQIDNYITVKYFKHIICKLNFLIVFAIKFIIRHLLRKLGRFELYSLPVMKIGGLVQQFHPVT